jgi:hypothetical protein
MAKQTTTKRQRKREVKCYLCNRDRAGHDKWNLYCAAWAEHDFTTKKQRKLMDQEERNAQERINQALKARTSEYYTVPIKDQILLTRMQLQRMEHDSL